MEQFSNFTFVKQVSLEVLGSKFNMSRRLNCLLEEQIGLTKYGEAVKHISFSPLIGEVFPPISKYIPSENTLEVQYLMDPQQAIEADEAQFFRLMLEQFIAAMEEMELPEDFDFPLFKEDLKALRFEQLQQVA